MRYQCPNCKAVVTSTQKLEYCICGGKYKTMADEIIEMFAGATEKRRENLAQIIDKATDFLESR